MRKIIKMFSDANVCVSGLKGTGKDMLMGNVIARRGIPYVSNTDYGGQFIKFNPKDFTCGGNSYKNFMEDDVLYYEWPYADGTDVYVADLGVYAPSQYCNELNRRYPGIPVFMAISRHVGLCNFHFNVQNLNRVWDKIREQSDYYISCKWCFVLFGKIVLQKIIIYELYDSAVRRVPAFRLKKPLLSVDRRFQWELAKQNYEIAHGLITPRVLVYWNKAKYDTRVFREMLKNGKMA